jgi:uncharacterized membrane protein
MINDAIFVLTFVSALVCGLVAGIFFAFSAFVMKALTHLPPAQGFAAMQAINVAVLNRWFFAAFFGTPAGCLLLAVSSLLMWQVPEAIYQLIGSSLYLIGTILVTIAFNVPRTRPWRLSRLTAPTARPDGRSSFPVGRLGIMCGRLRPWQPPQPSRLRLCC